jgi:hypothetical protein
MDIVNFYDWSLSQICSVPAAYKGFNGLTLIIQAIKVKLFNFTVYQMVVHYLTLLECINIFLGKWLVKCYKYLAFGDRTTVLIDYFNSTCPFSSINLLTLYCSNIFCSDCCIFVKYFLLF